MIEQNSAESRNQLMKTLLSLRNEVSKISLENRSKVLQDGLAIPLNKTVEIIKNMDTFSVEANHFRKTTLEKLEKEITDCGTYQKVVMEYVDYYNYLTTLYVNLDMELGLNIDSGCTKTVLTKQLDLLLALEKLFVFISNNSAKYKNVMLCFNDLQTIIVNQLDNLEEYYSAMEKSIRDYNDKVNSISDTLNKIKE